MITEVEFVAIKAFDRQLAENTSEAQRIINHKNAVLFKLTQHVAALEADLEQERARRRRAEFLLARG